MLKIYKLVGEEPIVAEFLRNDNGDIHVRNPLIPRMRNVVGDNGQAFVGVGWSTVVQFVDNLIDTMEDVKLPSNSIMWQGEPTIEVANSYQAAIDQIQALARGEGYNPPSLQTECAVPNKLN